MNLKKLSKLDIKSLIFCSAPERYVDLMQLWETYKPQIEVSRDDFGFKLTAGPYNLLIFDCKTICQIWLVGYLAQRAFNAYAGNLFISRTSGQSGNPTDFDNDEFCSEHFKEAEMTLSEISKLNKMECLEKYVWPKNIPKPLINRPTDIDGAMFFDLLWIAMGCCFLHELKHIVFQCSDIHPNSHEEEFECDSFARDFLLQKVDAYAQISKNSIKKLKKKRSMAIALSLVLILVITPKDLWAGSDKHPSISKRIIALTESISLSENDYFWIYLSCLLLFILKKNDMTICPFVVKSYKSYCLQLINILN